MMAVLRSMDAHTGLHVNFRAGERGLAVRPCAARAANAVWSVGREEAGMRPRLIFVRNASRQELELSAATYTIGRGPECDLQVADDRVSIRHCRLSEQGGQWMLEDLRSTNRTFVNGEPVGERSRRLADGDVVRFGAPDAALFEAKFVTGERAVPHRQEPRAIDEAVRLATAKLEAALGERDAELARLRAMYKRAQSEVHERDASAAAARQQRAAMASEMEALRDELAIARADHASLRDAEARALQRCAELEADARKLRKQIDDAGRLRRDLEAEIGFASSKLTTANQALATAVENCRALKEANDGLVAQLHAAEPPNGPSSGGPVVSK